MERGRERPREGARGDEAAWAGRAPGAPSWRDSDPPHGEPGGRGGPRRGRAGGGRRPTRLAERCRRKMPANSDPDAR